MENILSLFQPQVHQLSEMEGLFSYLEHSGILTYSNCWRSTPYPPTSPSLQVVLIINIVATIFFSPSSNDQEQVVWELEVSLAVGDRVRDPLNTEPYVHTPHFSTSLPKTLDRHMLHHLSQSSFRVLFKSIFYLKSLLSSTCLISFLRPSCSGWRTT